MLPFSKKSINVETDRVYIGKYKDFIKLYGDGYIDFV